MDCLHCNGTGTEPFSDDEDCTVCDGAGDVPQHKNLTYYKRVQERLADDDTDRELERLYRPKLEAETGQTEPTEAVHQHFRNEVEEVLDWGPVTVNDVDRAVKVLEHDLAETTTNDE